MVAVSAFEIVVFQHSFAGSRQICSSNKPEFIIIQNPNIQPLLQSYEHGATHSKS